MEGIAVAFKGTALSSHILKTNNDHNYVKNGITFHSSSFESHSYGLYH